MSAGAIMMVGANGDTSPEISSFDIVCGSIIFGYKSVVIGYNRAAEAYYTGTISTRDFILLNGGAGYLGNGDNSFYTNDSFLVFNFSVADDETQPDRDDIEGTMFKFIRTVNNTTGVTKDLQASQFVEMTGASYAGYQTYHLQISSGAGLNFSEGDSVTITLRSA